MQAVQVKLDSEGRNALCESTAMTMLQDNRSGLASSSQKPRREQRPMGARRVTRLMGERFGGKEARADEAEPQARQTANGNGGEGRIRVMARRLDMQRWQGKSSSCLRMGR